METDDDLTDGMVAMSTARMNEYRAEAEVEQARRPLRSMIARHPKGAAWWSAGIIIFAIPGITEILS